MIDMKDATPIKTEVKKVIKHVIGFEEPALGLEDANLYADKLKEHYEKNAQEHVKDYLDLLTWQLSLSTEAWQSGNKELAFHRCSIAHDFSIRFPDTAPMEEEVFAIYTGVTFKLQLRMAECYVHFGHWYEAIAKKEWLIRVRRAGILDNYFGEEEFSVMDRLWGEIENRDESKDNAIPEVWGAWSVEDLDRSRKDHERRMKEDGGGAVINDGRIAASSPRVPLWKRGLARLRALWTRNPVVPN